MLDRRRMRARLTWRNWVRQGLAALVVLALAQLGWIAFHVPADQWHAELRYAEYDCSRQRICTMRADPVDVADKAAGRPYRFTVNAQGFRGVDHARVRAEPTALRVALFGSSPVFGLGVRDEETLAVALSRELGARLPGRAVEVLNFGLPETSFASALATYEDFARDYEPDALVFVQPEVTHLADMNDRLRQIDRSRLLRWLLGFRWGRRIVNRYQYLTMNLEEDRGVTGRPAPALGPAMRGLAEDARRRGFPILFFSLWGRLGPLAEVAPPGLAWIEVQSGLARDEYLVSPLVQAGDGHPNAAGHRRFAAQIAEALAPRLPAAR